MTLAGIRAFRAFGSQVVTALSGRGCNTVSLVVCFERLQGKLSKACKSPKSHKTLTREACFFMCVSCS